MVYYCSLTTSDWGAINTDEFTNCFEEKTQSDSIVGNEDLDQHNWNKFYKGLKNVEMDLKQRSKA